MTRVSDFMNEPFACITVLTKMLFELGLPSFYRASICEGGLGSRNSVRLSVCLLHAWIVKKKLNDALQIF